MQQCSNVCWWAVNQKSAKCGLLDRCHCTIDRNDTIVFSDFAISANDLDGYYRSNISRIHVLIVLAWWHKVLKYFKHSNYARMQSKRRVWCPLLNRKSWNVFANLTRKNQQRVLDFVAQLETERPLSARELMKLPYAERQRRVKAAIESSAHEDFETFEAYSEELIDD